MHAPSFPHARIQKDSMKLCLYRIINDKTCLLRRVTANHSWHEIVWEPRRENELLAKRDYILFKHPSRAENSGNLLCYKPLAVLAIQRDNSEELIGTHQSQSGCNSTGVSSSQLLFKLLNNDDNIVLGLWEGFFPLRVIFIKRMACKVSISLLWKGGCERREGVCRWEGWGGSRRWISPGNKSMDAPLSPDSLPRRGFLFRSRQERVGSAQMCPRCGNQLRLIFRLDYLAYLMIFASLLSSIVFTRTAGY